VGLGSPFVGTGDTALSLPLPPFDASPLAAGLGSRLPAPPLDVDTEGDTEASDADSPGRVDPPVTAAPPAPLPSPPLTVDLPSGAAPPCRPVECAGAGPPASSPTLIQPVAAATAITVAARRTGT
jgi:hypothetical protein